MREVSQTIGATVHYDPKLKTIRIKKDQILIELQINSSQAVFNGENLTLNQAPIIMYNRTLVPVRFVSEAFGAKVEWNAKTYIATITSDDKVIYVRALRPGTYNLDESFMSYVKKGTLKGALVRLNMAKTFIML